MITIEKIHEKTIDGVTIYTTVLDVTSNRILKYIINTQVPYVWQLHHSPNPAAEWWKASVPLNKTGKNYNLEIRNMWFDIQYDSRSFLELTEELYNSPISIIQSHKKMPDTLILGEHEELNYRMLIQNNFYSWFYLPDAYEHASFSCIDKTHLEYVLNHHTCVE